jgi:hypothetical protein
LKLEYDGLLSKFGFKFNMRRYISVAEGEDGSGPAVPCIGLSPFRVGPGEVEVRPLGEDQLCVGFAPPQAGAYTRPLFSST